MKCDKNKNDDDDDDDDDERENFFLEIYNYNKSALIENNSK